MGQVEVLRALLVLLEPIRPPRLHHVQCVLQERTHPPVAQHLVPAALQAMLHQAEVRFATNVLWEAQAQEVQVRSQSHLLSAKLISFIINN